MGSSESKPAPARPKTPPPPPLVETPWRKLKKQWDPEYSQEILDEVKAINTGCEEVKNPGLLLLGPIKAGKSTFINSIFSIGKGRMVNKAYTGSAAKSYTVSFTRFRGTGVMKNFRLCDTMGVEDGDEEGFHISDIIYLIQGHIRDKYKFNSRLPIEPSDITYNPDPKPEEKIHCVVFVIDAVVLFSGSVSGNLRLKIHELQKKIKELGVPRVLILTKIDQLCPKVAEDIRNIFHSTRVQKTVKRASELFAIPETNIHPVKNYEGEIEIDPLINIPLLLALRQIMHFACDFIEDNDQKSD